MTVNRQHATRSLVLTPVPQSSRSANSESRLQAPRWAVRKDSAYRTSGKAAPPWHRTYAHPISDSTARRTHSLVSPRSRWLQSKVPLAVLAVVGFPSPCSLRRSNPSSGLIFFTTHSDFYHGLLGDWSRGCILMLLEQAIADFFN